MFAQDHITICLVATVFFMSNIPEKEKNINMFHEKRSSSDSGPDRIHNELPRMSCSEVRLQLEAPAQSRVQGTHGAGNAKDRKRKPEDGTLGK